MMSIPVFSHPARVRARASRSWRSTVRAVGALDLDHARREAARVHGRQPTRGVVVPFLAVHSRRRQRQVAQVLGEPPPGGCIGRAEAAVVGLGAGHDVLDVGLPLRPEAAAAVRAVHPAEAADNAVLDRLAVPVVVAVARAAPRFRRFTRALLSRYRNIICAR